MDKEPRDHNERKVGYGEGGEYPADSPERGGTSGEHPERHPQPRGGVGGEFPEKDQPPRGGMGGEYPEGEGVNEPGQRPRE